MVLSEFEIIRRFFHRGAISRQDVALGIGDDGAVVRVADGYDLIISTDMLISGVHFPADAEPNDIGFRALAVNLSDLAAMGAEPAWATLVLSLPEASEPWLSAFARGFFSLADAASVQLIGGDIARGPLTITVSVYGSVPRGRALLRSGARPGDRIFVTGTLGDAAAALETDLKTAPATHTRVLRQRLLHPMPRFIVGIGLRGVASSAIDISDGLASDLGHIAEASGVGARVEVASLPLSEPLRRLLMRQRAWELALSGGDDYELCFTAPARHEALVASLAHSSDCTITQIGVIESELGLRWRMPDGSLLAIARPGYRHF
ncbi:MAG: thiamine-phosphate kinase [Gammaproteobacteria bacterium]